MLVYVDESCVGFYEPQSLYLRRENFEKVERKLFRFGSRFFYFSRQSEKILAPFFRDLGTTIGVFLARKNKSNSFADIDSMDQHRNSMASCREDSLHLKKLKLALYRIQIYNC